MKHIKFEPRVGDLPSLEQLNNQISMEAFSLTSMLETVSSALPRFITNARSFFMDVKTRMGFTATEIHAPSSFTRYLKEMGYGQASLLSMHVPEGFRGKLDPYAVLLQDSTDHSGKLLNGVLIPYRDFLSSLIGSKDALRSTQEPLQFLDRMRVEREKLGARYKTFFTLGSVETERKMGDLVDRLADWDGVFIKLQAIDRATQSQDLKKIDQVIDEIVELLDVLQDMSKRGQLNSINPKQLKGLSTSTLQAAQEAEFTAVTRHRVVTFTSAMEENVRFISELA